MAISSGCQVNELEGGTGEQKHDADNPFVLDNLGLSVLDYMFSNLLLCHLLHFGNASFSRAGYPSLLFETFQHNFTYHPMSDVF